MKKIDYIIYLLVLIIIIILGYLFFNRKVDLKEENLIVNERSIFLKVGEGKLLDVYVENKENPLLSYISLDESIAKVGQDGFVEGISVGNTVIIINYVNSLGQSLSGECVVNVSLDESKIINSVSFEGDNLLIKKGEIFRLNYHLEPNNVPSNVTFSSSDEDIVSVDDDNNIIAKKEGIAVVKIKVNEQLEDEVTVYVKDKDVSTGYITLPNSISVVDTNMELIVDEEKIINYTVEPFNASKELVNIKSTDTSVVTIQDDKVKAVGIGNATIIMEINNNLQATISVSVKEKTVKVDYITITSINKVSIKKGETSQITYQISPSNATNQEVIFESLDKNIATVSDTGLITGVSKGETKIIVTTKDGLHQVFVDVIVTATSSSSNLGACNTSDPMDTEFNKCFVASRNLIVDKSYIEISAGSSGSVKVSLPSSCGTLVNWTRKTADGQTGWRDYVSQSRSNETNSGFTWIITAKASAKGKTVLVSQTVEYNSRSPSGKCTGTVKSMKTITVKIT